MPESELLDSRKKDLRSARRHDGHPVFRHVLACVDASSASRTALAHAAAIASATGARLTAMRVLEPPAGQTPADPVEWRLCHRDVEAELKESMLGFGDLDADVVVIGGRAAECICAWARDNGVDLTVLAVAGDSTWPFAGLGGTARRVVEATDSSVLLVPRSEHGDAAIRYRRVMTPLDGSPRSESALPTAMAIAAAHEAEVVLVHAAPNIDLTEIGPVEAEAIALRDQLRRRNELVAEKYLRRVRSHLPRMSALTRTRVLASGDARHALARAALADRADIIILSSTGFGGHPDLSIGSVAEYLVNHANRPILLVRGKDGAPPQTRWRGEERQAVRLPSRALM